MRLVLGRLWVVLALGAVACSAPQPQPDYVDQMHFVDDEAMEPAVSGPNETRLPPGTVISRPGRAPATDEPPPVGGPRCAGDKSGPSRSPGKATAGQLTDGCELPRRGPGWVRRNAAAWGTDGTVAILQWALAEVVRLHPGTVPVVIGALSRQQGGRLRPHRSHQSGRDVDIGYYSSNNEPLAHFSAMHGGNIDVEKTWTLMGAMLYTGKVHYIFVDYDLQALLVRYLEDQGTEPQTLARVFQYPAGRTAKRGIIRHARGHADHFHIRFRCTEDDGEDCVD